MSEINIKENLRTMIDRLVLQYEDKMDIYNKEGLRRCPFCGSLKVSVVDTGYWNVVMCDKCHACSETVPYHANYSSKEKAIKLWNERY